MSNDAWHLTGRGARGFKSSTIGTFLAIMIACLVISGCHSAYMNAIISNHTPTPITLVQVEYPSASFGTQTIAPGQEFKYRFKVLGSGTVKVSYTDAARVEHKEPGPSLKEGDEGALTIDVEPGKTVWKLALASK